MRKRFIPVLILALLLSGCGFAYYPPGGYDVPLAEPPIHSSHENRGEPGPDATESELPAGMDTLTVHFIDVGQADCILLECCGEYMIIDGGNVDDSSLVVSYLRGQGVEELSAVVSTHPHEDHVGGLPAVLAVFPTAAVYAPTRTYSSECFDDFLRYTDQQGLDVTIPVPGDSFTLGSATVTVLGPVQSYAQINDTSLVLRVDFGTTSFLFTGDMETTAETDLLDSGAAVSADVLKVGHHGSDTSTGYHFLYEVEPEYAVISVGEGNSYGHPHEAPLSRLEDAGCTILRTDELGTILAVSDGSDISFSWEKNSPITQDSDCYIGNLNSLRFHLPTCTGLPLEKNQILFSSYEEAVEAGYTPCSHCLGA